MVRSQVTTFKAALLSGAGFVASQVLAAAPTVEVDQCMQRAAAKHGVSYVLVRAIAEQESSFNPSAVRKPNTAGGDSSTDFGLMQINSGWLNTLRKYGVSKEDLFKPCINADVGAWILADNIRRHGLTWNAVGAYNAQTQWKRVKYATGVHSKVQRFLTSRAKTTQSNQGSLPEQFVKAEQPSEGSYSIRTVALAPARSPMTSPVERKMAAWEASNE